ncbi:MAG: hypothetical protein ABUT20_30375 [Bacteroidota bacterium]
MCMLLCVGKKLFQKEGVRKLTGCWVIMTSIVVKVSSYNKDTIAIHIYAQWIRYKNLMCEREIPGRELNGF